MGKERKQRNRKHKENPTGILSVEDFERENEILAKESFDQVLEKVLEQLSAANIEEKLSGLQQLEVMCNEQSVAISVSQSETIKILGPLLVDESNMVRAAAASACRSIADNGGDEAIVNLLKNDIITPLAALLKRHYLTWHPNIQSPSNAKQTVNYNKETFFQAVSLLWTLAEKNDIVLKRSQEEHLITVLLPFLNTQIYDLDISIVAIQCILTLSEDNPFFLEQIKANKDQVFKLLELETSDALNEGEVLMLRTLAAGLIVNIYEGFSKNQNVAIVGKCLTVLSKTLSFNYEDKLIKLVELIEKEKNNSSHNTIKKLKDLRILVNAQIQTVEILANLCTEQDFSDLESNASDNNSFDSNILNGEECSEDDTEIYEEPMNEEFNEMDSPLCIEAIEVIINENVIQKVLNKTNALAKNIEEVLKTTYKGNGLLKRFKILRCRSFHCLTNFILNLNSETIGDIDFFFRMWSETGKLVFNEIDINDVELLDAATSLMRSALQKINELQGNPFQHLTLADLQPMLNGERQSSSPSVRANLINILGSLALILVKNNFVHSGELIQCIAEFLLNSCMEESEIWVIAEALDAIMDIFSEDETDKMALDINLIKKLTSLSSILQTKFRQQKHTLGDNRTIVLTVKANLGRFLKYKAKRVALLRT